MLKSESIKELASALSKAQAKLKNPAFDSHNPHFKSKYASLASVRDTVIPVLSECGLSVAQLPVCEDGKAGCITVLMHASGEWIEQVLLIPTDRQNAHGVGSAITYSRRFSLMAIAGVVGDDDDDGNAAVDQKRPATTITPTTGAWDGIPPERSEILKRIGGGVIDYFAAGDPEGAYKYLASQQIDNDEKVAVWTMFDSKQRSALKKFAQSKQLAEQA